MICNFSSELSISNAVYIYDTEVLSLIPDDITSSIANNISKVLFLIVSTETYLEYKNNYY